MLPRRPARDRLARAVTVGVLALGTAACGSAGGGSFSSSAGGGSITFTGDITGTWHRDDAPETPSTCGESAAAIAIVGPAEGDEGELRVTSGGKVTVDVEKYGDFDGDSGATLHPSQGFVVDSDVATARGKKAHVKGSLNC
ncbi:MAG TPA: hypothetical protein VJU79_05020 [Candidatus Dormibacteraeota bacterium]|nr:hypothetical protein [Candidatus Dormibacteraeota bacterium]